MSFLDQNRFVSFFKGFLVTGKQPLKPKVTVEYPEQKRPKPERAHGRHVLNRYEDGMEKCIGCELCAGVCPARCIYVRGADNPPDAPVSPGRAVRLRVRDQFPALYPLRPLCRGLPDRGDNRIETVRVLLHQPGRRHLHQGRAGRGGFGASPRRCHGRTGTPETTATRQPGCGRRHPRDGPTSKACRCGPGISGTASGRLKPASPTPRPPTCLPISTCRYARWPRPS